MKNKKQNTAVGSSSKDVVQHEIETLKKENPHPNAIVAEKINQLEAKKLELDQEPPEDPPAPKTHLTFLGSKKGRKQ